MSKKIQVITVRVEISADCRLTKTQAKQHIKAAVNYWQVKVDTAAEGLRVK